jgi:energy-coupling factor transport system ATP-binding protein
LENLSQIGNKNNEYIIEIKNVSYKYPGSDKRALRNINLKIKKGEIVLITGRNGAGKSTLCYLLNGLIPHFFGGELEGTVKILGMDTKETPVSYLSTKVGLLFSEPSSQLLTSSVEDEIAFPLENLGLPPEEIDRIVNKILELFELMKYRKRPPYALSGGEQQLVALATVLSMNPEIYVLDEPTSVLDPIGTIQVIEMFRTIARMYNKTFIIVEHKLEEFALLTTRLIVMDNGQIVYDGSPYEILTKKAIELENLGLEVPQIPLFVQKLLDKCKQEVESSLELPLTIEKGLEWFLSNIYRFRPCFNSLLGREIAVNATKEKSLEEPLQVRGEPIIEVDHVTFIYPSTNAVALKDVSLKIYRGDFVAIIGHNGSGKTTLAKHLNGLLKPTKGIVKVFGMDTRKTPMIELIKHIGYVFQDPDKQLFTAKVIKELEFGAKNLKIPQDRMNKIFEKVVDELGLKDLLNENPFFLSRGDRQRVAIASILTMDPEVLIFDEPTTGQDPKGRREIMEVAKKLHKDGKTIIFITHDMHLVAEYAQRVIVMHDGRIIMDSTPRNVFKMVDELKKIKLKPPSITELFLKLESRGLKVDIIPLTVEEAINILGEILKGD